MTDHKGNRKIYLAQGIQEYPESQRDFSVGRGIGQYLFYYIIICLKIEMEQTCKD